mmetsp:Transcript_74907/g.156174  ORF Transcript_74907/g.156174 Transcript_74907/m.156174 type:complete len:82 (+) Transcript_74907:4462-4707(+)
MPSVSVWCLFCVHVAPTQGSLIAQAQFATDGWYSLLSFLVQCCTATTVPCSVMAENLPLVHSQILRFPSSAIQVPMATLHG